MVFKSKFSVKEKTKELCFFDYFHGRFSQKNVRVWGKNVLLMEMNTDRLGGGELEAVLRHPRLNAVYTQLHSSRINNGTERKRRLTSTSSLTRQS